MRPLDPGSCRRLLVRGTNWVGDAVMTLPALEALANACPQARITVLAKPWVAAIYNACPRVAEVRGFPPETGWEGLKARYRLADNIRREGYDWAVLLQNALGAALIAWWARVPVRLGYASDGRGLLLTHPIARHGGVRQVHETSYYLYMLHRAGLLAQQPPPGGVRPLLQVDAWDRAWAADFLAQQGLGAGDRLLGMAPGAAYGPAKCWPAERFAASARELWADGLHAVLLLGSRGEASACRRVAQGLEGIKVLNLAGSTNLGQVLALLERLEVFITNDSGLMHAAAALGRPTVAVFGSTNPVTTAPLGPHTRILRHPVDCSPCLKPTCPLDLRCFTAIEPQEAAQAARELVAQAAGEALS